MIGMSAATVGVLCLVDPNLADVGGAEVAARRSRVIPRVLNAGRIIKVTVVRLFVK